MMTKSAVALLKKDDRQERGLVTDQCHDRSGKPDKRGEKSWDKSRLNVNFLMHGNWGLRISGHDAAEVYSPEGHRHAEANPACEVHNGYCASHQNPRPKSLAVLHLSR